MARVAAVVRAGTQDEWIRMVDVGSLPAMEAAFTATLMRPPSAVHPDGPVADSPAT